MSHDSVNRFLVRERYEPLDLFDEVKLYINLKDGTLSGEDTVIDKPYSEPQLTLLIGYFWSGKHHRVVKGIQLITLYYTDDSGKSVPVNYRLYNKQEGKTKNDNRGNDCRSFGLGITTKDSDYRCLVFQPGELEVP